MSGSAILIEQVRARLDADDELAVEVGLLVLAALDGREALERALAEDAPAPTDAVSDSVGTVHARSPQTSAKAYLHSISVQGFRGIGARATLAVAPGPGLTLVIGRNGSGKSSFAEALELLLTGQNRRWATRSAVWKQGWRNLHWDGAVEIEASFTIDGERAPRVARREWPEGSGDLDAGGPTLLGAGRGDGLASLGWDEALSTYRPFLPYNELGSIPDYKPSALYDLMSAALGLDVLVAARKHLRDLKLEREKHCREVEAKRSKLLASLQPVDDERARECARLIESPEANRWDLDRVETVLEGGDDPKGAGDIALLRELASLRPPDAAEAQSAAAHLRAALDAVEGVAETDADRAREVADLLDRSLALHAAHGDRPCPVCGEGALDGAWRVRTEAVAARLREEASDAVRARQELDTARHTARELLAAPPAVLRRCDVEGVDTAPLSAVWARWHDLPAGAPAAALAAHVEETHPDLVAASEAVRAAATRELERRENIWRPAARALREWLPAARSAAAASTAARALRAAETWLDTETGRIRAERFRPIADVAAAVWNELRQNSAVALDSLALAGSATTRRLLLDVSVDGAEGQALGVMSQGELHSLALSLFLPRVLLQDSPFGFVIIDDPVQAMDPGKVDGLARVLERTARKRQVVVFTHDERLPESVRRLQVAATVIEVNRRAGSAVECTPTRDPIKQYLDDARALTLTDDIPPDAAARAVPLFCRLSIEAACTETVRRRRLGRGERHADVEAALLSARTLLQKLALAMFDDRDRAGDVMHRANERWGRWAGDAIAEANRGTHAGTTVDQLAALIDGTARVADRARGLR